MLASLAQAGLYGLEGNSALAAHYLSQSLMIGLAGPVGGAVLGALSKMGPAAKVILGTVLGAQSLYTAGVAGINLYNSASKIADGLLNGDMSWLDAFCEGSMALNSAAGIYYSLKGLLGGCKLALKGLDDVAANYAAEREVWYKEHTGYSIENSKTVSGNGSVTLPKSIHNEEIGTKYSPINPGPLDIDDANSFRSATYTKKVLTEDTTFYRVYSSESNRIGPYMTRTLQNGTMQSQLDLALNPAWGNNATYVEKVSVPKGTTIYEGVAAPQPINGGTGMLLGGGNQIFINRKELDESWFHH